MLVNTTLEEFKSYFNRDFPFGSDIEENVLDADIERALTESRVTINPALFCTQEEFTVAFNNLTAHNLVTNLRISSAGLCSTFEGLVNSRSVGSVSEGITLPDAVTKDPFLSNFMSTGYGAKYLGMIYILSRGAFATVGGATRP